MFISNIFLQQCFGNGFELFAQSHLHNENVVFILQIKAATLGIHVNISRRLLPVMEDMQYVLIQNLISLSRRLGLELDAVAVLVPKKDIT
jgi:hypothetical protein